MSSVAKRDVEAGDSRLSAGPASNTLTEQRSGQEADVERIGPRLRTSW